MPSCSKRPTNGKRSRTIIRDDSNVIPLGARPPGDGRDGRAATWAKSPRATSGCSCCIGPRPNLTRIATSNVGWTHNTYKASEGYSGTVRLAVYAVPAAMSDQPDHTLDVRFGDAIRLTGYSLVGDTVAPGDIASTGLVLADPDAASQHATKSSSIVLGADDRIVTQVDREPGGGLVPTTIWQPGQTIVDRYGVAHPVERCAGSLSHCRGAVRV